MDATGARLGFLPDGANAHFYKAEAFADWDLPWSWSPGSDWRLKLRLDGSLGWLGKSSVNAFVASVGPMLVAGKTDFPISFDVGVSPTVLSAWDFPGKDLGGAFQITSHGGVNFDIAKKFRLGYRFEHMSNAGLSHPNPGLNLSVFVVSYVF